MLKTVSSITNAIGALNYKGTWNASTNTPTITSSVGVKGDYYVVSVSGTTNINGISNWGVGDWITFNGSVWQRVEGGADLNGVNLSVSGTTTLSGLTASTLLALNASKEVVSATTTLASYQWNNWNPSDLVGTSTNAPGTGTADDSDYVTMANASGTLTVTFDAPGKYFICITQQTSHGQVYSFDRQIANLGGTATRRIAFNPTNSGVDSVDANFSFSTGFYVSATAAQTLTILPTYELTGGGTTAQHTAACNVTIQYCGG